MIANAVPNAIAMRVGSVATPEQCRFIRNTRDNFHPHFENKAARLSGVFESLVTTDLKSTQNALVRALLYDK
jgi:hypothetical protein